MEGDVTAAVDPDELGADLSQPLRRGEHVGRVPAAADRVDREVLDEQQPVADATPSPLLGELVLELPRRPVGDRPEMLDGEHAAVRGEEGVLVARRAVRRIRVRRRGAIRVTGPGLMSRNGVSAVIGRRSARFTPACAARTIGRWSVRMHAASTTTPRGCVWER